MAELVPDSDARAMKPPPKRRRILDASAIVPVPVYSSKVNSLQLTSATPTFSEKEHAGDGLWSEFSCDRRSASDFTNSDSEEEEEEHGDNKAFKTQTEVVRCPSPPGSPVQKQSRKVIKTISEIDSRLQVLNSLLSPETRDRTETRTRSKRNRRQVSPPPTSKEEEQDDGDVIMVNPEAGSCSSPYSSSVREIPLKIRCRTDVHKIAVLSSTPVRDVLSQLSAVLHVPEPRLLLLKEEVELATDATVGEIGLGIADIVECVVMAAEDKVKGTDVITIKLQSKDRDSAQEFSLNRDAPLASVFSQYLSRVPPTSRTKVAFYFDGSKVTRRQTPAQLDMEDGDIVEVWT
ncbi:hypothetical protein JOB18_030550 [Solea senegalensis]|uniref:NFATC2-interacting protein n=2 Tax=Solea senegalensis TaxID=28829 RepID=A0AAV6RJ20_SOLSE|nr:hypothetical protein JOB18_030550 [Solea senegalensis]